MADLAAPTRTLPHNLEAEKSVLGAILIHNEAFNHAAEVIDAARLLPRRAPAHLRSSMVALSERSDAIDFVTLKEELSRARRARRGRRAGLHRVAGRRRAALGQRRVLRADRQGEVDAAQPDLTRPTRFCATPTRPRRSRTCCSTRPSVRSSRSPRTGSAPGSCRCAIWSQSSFATIEKLQQHKGLVTGVPTGFVDLDEMTSGLQPSDLVIVAARPSMGKTSFVLNIAQHVGT